MRWRSPTFLFVFLLAGCAGNGADGGPEGASQNPAFLDGPDLIKVWTPATMDPSAAKGKFLVTIDGKPVTVDKVEGIGYLGEAAKPDPKAVVVAGSFQHLLGGEDWQPGGPAGKMTPTTDGRLEFTARLPKGRYEYKIAVGGSWDVNYGKGFVAGGDNFVLTVPADGTIVRFVVDLAKKSIADSINNPDDVKAPTEAPAVVSKPKAFNVFALHLTTKFGVTDLAKDIEVTVDGGPPRRVFARDVLDTVAYDGSDLGATYSTKETTFKVWSPVSSKVDLLLAEGSDEKATPMSPQGGVWSVTVSGDLAGKTYRFRFQSYGESRTAPDIYCRAATEDGLHSVVLDWSKTEPEGGDKPVPIEGPTHAVVYEAHIRDLTIDDHSGAKALWQGKYLGLAQTGTTNGGAATGLDYVKGLGVSAIQLMPFQMANPAHRHDYDWGYETYLFNVPDSQYSTHPEDPVATITETRSMIKALHKAGLSVIMDVVYNHSVPSEGSGSPFWQTVPYFYFRTNDRGSVLNESGVGNALDDDHPMVRKYIGDSLEFWADKYGVDGFRFDLLGLFTTTSVKAWRARLDKVRPNIAVYGEPWTGGGPLRFGKGDQKGLAVGVFNDNYRNAVRGQTDGTGPGFALGGGNEEGVRRGVMGSIDDFTTSPGESVNYVSAHDNLTLWDKVTLTLPKADPGTQSSAVKLSGAMVLFAEGMPFLEGGVEMGRTKGGNRNSYNTGDAENRFDWSRGAKFQDLTDYYRGLIAVRRSEPLFALSDAAAVRAQLHFLAKVPEKTVAYTLGDKLLVIFYGGLKSAPLTLPEGDWGVLVDGTAAGTKPTRTISNVMTLQPLTAYVLKKG